MENISKDFLAAATKAYRRSSILVVLAEECVEAAKAANRRTAGAS